MCSTATHTEALRIVGGRVIDPLNGVDAVRDVHVYDGRIVDALPTGAAARTIDATGSLVLPGAIEMHTHVASRGVAVAHELDPTLVPAARETALAYLRLGYTTIIDAAVPPDDVPLAHATLDRMPAIDTGFLLELGTHDEVVHALAHHGEAEALEIVDGLVTRSGAFGIKLVNLRHAEGLDAPLSGTTITPRRLIHFAAEAAEHLPLVHPVHLHVPDLGDPDNVVNTMEALDALNGHRGHLAHAQFYAYQQDANGALCSGAVDLCEYLAAHENVTCDSGCIALGPAMMITRDHPLGERLAALTGATVTQRRGWSVMPMRYAADNPVNAVQWATGLELILRSADLSRIAMSVDHPNGGPFGAVPTLLELLADRAARAAALAEVHKAARQRSGLAKLKRELSDAELVMLTRGAPAKALGLDDRGHLGSGAVADVVIVERVWSEPTVVVKSGRVMVEDGEVAKRMAAGVRLSAVSARPGAA
ncbi:MAG: amidohydrolase family protein [Phycisphaeraceae bacterium]